jgi:hypothetical protein
MPAKKVTKTVKKPAANKPVAAKTSKPEPRAVVRPGISTLAPTLEAAVEASTDHVAYKGAVPVKSFVGWLLVVLVAAAVMGGLAAQLLVSQRLSQLVEDTSERVALQGQNRAAVVAEWAGGLNRAADSVARAELVRLFLADRQSALAGNAPAATDLTLAVRAQAPYIQRLLAEFLTKQNLTGAHLVLADGAIVLSTGKVPETLSNGKELLNAVVRSAQGSVQPVRLDAQGNPVMDILRPVLALEGNAQAGQPSVLGILWVTVPVGSKLTDLTAASPLDRPGERTVVVQAGFAGDLSKAAVLGRTNISPLAQSLERLISKTDSGRTVVKSPLDGAPVFATVVAIEGTPLAVLQEYAASSALSIMDIYKPGLYITVLLLVSVLASLMLALTIHLMSQRNRTRVKLLGQTMDALIRVVEARDPHLAGHHARVARMAVAVGNATQMGVGERATLYYAAQLSAVGRLLVPRDVLAKRGAYTAAERKNLESHINQAMTILGGLEFDLPVVNVISQMYERIDGSGHPHGLRGYQINRMAKVLGTVDAFAALTSDRPYRKALSKPEALKAMQNGQFDEVLLTTLKAVGK